MIINNTENLNGLINDEPCFFVLCDLVYGTMGWLVEPDIHDLK